MRRKDRQITDDNQINAVIAECTVCRLGFYDGNEVYIVPLNFGFEAEGDKRVFYFHGAGEGRKAELIRSAPRVAFELDCGYSTVEGKTTCGYSALYKSVMGVGTVSEVIDRQEKRAALTSLMNHTAGQGEWSFDERSLDAVFVFRLTVDEISCKAHI